MKAKVSIASAWTELEKLQVLLSIVDTVKPIAWDKVANPEGRSRKAVSCMIDGLKKQAHAGTPSAVSSPTKPQTPNGKATKRKRTTKNTEKDEAGDDEEKEGSGVNKRQRVKSQNETNKVIQKEEKQEEGDTGGSGKYSTETGEEDGEEI